MLELLQTGAARTGQTPSLQDEWRLVERLLHHWTEMAAGGWGFPQLNEIDPWMVSDDWTNSLLVAVRSPIERSHFVVVGDNLLSEGSRLLDGAAVALCPRNTLVYVLLSLVPQVLSARCCLIAEGVATHQGVAILYRSALLPLSEDGVAIDHMLGAANYRALLAGEAPTTQPIPTHWL
jgi:hypothetical protein